ncbi:hypothetical protein AAG906_022268 [Vitis piasezkii]
MEGLYRVLSALVVVGLLTNKALATQHVVGGSQGWDESSDYSKWASGQTFEVGDQLVFKYTPGLHSVVELPNESAYKNCDVGSALNSMNSGNNVVKLSKAGTRYFACGTIGHCDQGMKLKVTTVSADASSSQDQLPFFFFLFFAYIDFCSFCFLPFASMLPMASLLAISMLSMF